MIQQIAWRQPSVMHILLNFHKNYKKLEVRYRMLLKVEELEKELKQGNLQCLYLLYGEEVFLLETCLKKIRKQFGILQKGINDIRIEAENIERLISDLQTPAFGFEKKLIIARNTGLFKKEGKKKAVGSNTKIVEKITQYIKENVDSLKQSVVLIFIEEEAEKNELYQVIEKNGIVCNFEYLKPMQIIARLKAISNAYQVQIEERLLQYLIECVGSNMQDLMNELRKLIEYAGSGGVIQKEDIDALCIKKMDSVIFELTDNLGKKNIQKALQVLHNLLYAKEPIQKITITLYNHFKKLYFTKLAEKTKEPLVSVLNLKPNQTFLVTKYKQQASYFSEEKLRKILAEMIDLDENSKNGNIDMQIGLEAILCEYCS